MADKSINNTYDMGLPTKFADLGDGTFAQVFGVAKQSGAGGFATVNRLLSAAASTNPTLVKATPGRLYHIRGYNAAVTVRYLKIYNKASAPTVGTDTPVLTFPLAASAVFDIDLGLIGWYCSAGIGYGLTVNVADADTTALTAADVAGLMLIYA